MHLKVRSKLLLLICIPLVTTYGLMLCWDYVRQRTRAREQVEELVLGRADMSVSLIDARLAQAQQLGNLIADVVEQRQDHIDVALRTRIQRAMVPYENLVGVVIALEPDTPQTEPRNAVIRRGLGATELPPSYKYDSPTCRWYWRTRTTRRAQWYTEKESAGIFLQPTLSYCVPLIVGDQFRGVASIHVSPSIFRWTRIARVGRNAIDMEPTTAPTTSPVGGEADVFDLTYDRYIIAQEDGEIVYHSPEKEQVPSSLLDPAFESIVQPFLETLGGELDYRSEIALVQTGAQKVFLFEPHSSYFVALVPTRSGGFVFLTSYPETELMAPTYRLLAQRAAFLFAGLLILLGIIYAAAKRILRPIEELEPAVVAAGEGDLSVQVPEHRGHDEIANLARMFNLMLVRIRGQMERIRQEAQARALVENELQLARQIQTDLLPRGLPQAHPEAQYELHAVNLPANHVAGDYYDYFVDASGRLTLVIADVAGHGVAAAIMMAITRTLIRNLAAAHSEPAEIAYQTNRVLREDNTSGMFVTLILAIYEPQTGAITFVNAGHPEPFVLRASGDIEELSTSTAPLLGVADFDRSEFDQRTLTLLPGDALALYTDGIPEAVQATTGEAFGEHRFLAALAGPAGRPLPQVEADVVRAVEQFQQGPLSDDITLLFLRRL